MLAGGRLIRSPLIIIGQILTIGRLICSSLIIKRHNTITPKVKQYLPERGILTSNTYLKYLPQILTS